MKLAIAFFGLTMAGCIAGTGDADVRSSRAVTFAAPSLPPGVGDSGTWTTQGETTIDLHDKLQSIARVGATKVNITGDALAGADLSFVDAIEATLAVTGAAPRDLADVVVTPGSDRVELTPRIPEAELAAYFVNGPVVLHVTLTGRLPSRPITLTNDLDAHVEVTVGASVDKL